MNQSEFDTASESHSTIAVDEQPAAASEAAAEVAPEGAATSGKPDPTRGFLAELAHAMRGAAERERERISAEVDASAEAHVEKVRTRAATEAAELRRLAEEDIDSIHAWSREETIRIQQETERRIGTRREELQGYLIRHATIIDGEVGHIEGAVLEYRTELDHFFERLASESDPAGFARMADEMPDPPDLGKVGGAARAKAMAALAEEQDAADEGVANGVASAAVNGEQASAPTAFDPAHSGPDLVPVMGDANGMANTNAVVASVVASGDAPKADAATESAETDTVSDAATDHPNVAVRLLRTIASSLSPAEHPTESAEPAAKAVAVSAEPAAQADQTAQADEAPQTDETKA